MTDTTEQEALALVTEIRKEATILTGYDGQSYQILTRWADCIEALCRAIERDKAFRQEVSDVFEATISALDQLVLGERDEAMVRGIRIATARFIIAKPLDPLVDAWQMAFPGTHIEDARDECATISAAIEKRGGKIVWGEG